MRRLIIGFFCFALWLCPCTEIFSQRQLVVISGDKVVATFTEGSLINFITKKGEKKQERIVELSEFSMITSGDTIMLNAIGKIKIRERKAIDFRTGLGGLLFVGGIGYLIVDQVNSALGYNPPGLSASVLTTSLVLMGTGAALVFANPRYIRIRGRVVIRSVDYKSPFYQK